MDIEKIAKEICEPENVLKIIKNWKKDQYKLKRVTAERDLAKAQLAHCQTERDVERAEDRLIEIIKDINK